MSRPNNALAKIKLPGENDQRPIIPYAIGFEVSDGEGGYTPGSYIAKLPNLSQDTYIATLHTKNVFFKEQIFTKYIAVWDSDQSETPAVPRPSNIYNYNIPETFFFGTGITLYEAGAQEETYYQYNYPNKSGTFALLGNVIEEVASYAAIPNNTTGLYRYPDTIEGVNQSSHIIEVIREDHGAEEVTFEKTTETNNTSLTTSTFFDQFNSSLSGLMSMSAASNIYTLRYAYNGETVENGIRFGTGSAIGSITVTFETSCTLTFKWYYSYNGSTGEIVSYDGASRVVIGENTYTFDDENTPLNIELEAGTYTIQSYYGGDSSTRGRLILITLEFEGEPYSIYTKKELARVEEVQAVDQKLTQHITTSNQRFADDERQINTNKNDITDINNRMGDIQAWDVVWRLPNPSANYVKKVLRYQNKFYQCVQVGDGVLKTWSFENVNGTSEITSSNVESFYGDVGSQFNDYFEVKYDTGDVPSKFYRNNGSIKLGSSSATGQTNFCMSGSLELPLTMLKIGFKAYNSNGSTAYIRIENESSNYNTIFISDTDEETLIDLTDSIVDLGKSNSIHIESLATHTVDEQEVNNDKRLIITRIIAEFGTMEYQWIPIGGTDIKITDLTSLAL